MILSKFNVIEPIEDGILLYNTNSGGILKLNKEYEMKYYSILERNRKTDIDLQNALIEGGMLLSDKENFEIEKIFLENAIARFGGNSIGLTIAPTMACNFRCPYCYEKGKEYVTMSTETKKKMKEYIRSLKERYQYINITWYGGEPLLVFDIVEELMEEVYRSFDKEYVTAYMVTNGYLLKNEIVKKMKELNINGIQVTIDGPPKIHNKRRKLPSGEDTFFVILNNMKKALAIYPELKIAIRVNVDKGNISSVDEIVSYLKEYGVLEKTKLYLAPVTDINDTCIQSQCFKTREFALEEFDFMERHQKKGISFINLPRKNIGMCGAVSANSWVIDAKGDLYKCWDDVGAISEKVGSIYEGVDLGNKNLMKWLMYSIDEDEECKKCSCLPICMGGCPNYRIKNKKRNCHPIKENASQIVHLVYEVLQQRKEKHDYFL